VVASLVLVLAVRGGCFVVGGCVPHRGPAGVSAHGPSRQRTFAHVIPPPAVVAGGCVPHRGPPGVSTHPPAHLTFAHVPAPPHAPSARTLPPAPQRVHVHALLFVSRRPPPTSQQTGRRSLGQAQLPTHFAPVGVSTQVAPTEHVVLAHVAGGGAPGHSPSEITFPGPLPHCPHSHELPLVSVLPPPTSQQTGWKSAMQAQPFSAWHSAPAGVSTHVSPALHVVLAQVAGAGQRPALKTPPKQVKQ
jgi:hypothetical protein